MPVRASTSARVSAVTRLPHAFRSRASLSNSFLAHCSAGHCCSVVPHHQSQETCTDVTRAGSITADTPSSVIRIPIAHHLIVKYHLKGSDGSYGTFVEVTFTAVDSEPPTVSCPSPAVQSVFTQPGQDHALIAYATR